MGPQYKRNLGQVKRSQQRATKIARRHEHNLRRRAEAGCWAWDLYQLQNIRGRLVNNVLYKEWSVFPDPKSPVWQIVLDFTQELTKKGGILAIWFRFSFISWQTLTEPVSPRPVLAIHPDLKNYSRHPFRSVLPETFLLRLLWLG